MRWPERWETSLSAPLFEQTNPQRPAARLVAVPEIGFFLAVALARAFTDTFAGIRPADVAGFIVAQLLGAFAATVLFRWLVPSLPCEAKDVVFPHADIGRQ